MVESLELVAFGLFMLISGIAIVRKPLLGEFNVGNAKIERILGRIFGVLGILFGIGLIYFGL